MHTTTYLRPSHPIDHKVARYAAKTARDLYVPLVSAAMAAVDLRTSKTRFDVSGRATLDILSRNLDEITLLLDEIQALAALGEGPPLLGPAQTSMRAFLTEVIGDLHERVPRIHFVLSCREDVQVDIDPDWFRRSLFCLLGRGNIRSGASNTVTIAAYRAPALAIVAIHAYDDQSRTGPEMGSPSAATPEPDPSDDYWSFETARIIIQAHDGMLWRDRSVRYGTKFLLTLPTEDMS